MNFNFEHLPHHIMDSTEKAISDAHWVAYVASEYGSQPRGAYYDDQLDKIMYVVPKGWDRWFPGYETRKVELEHVSNTYHDLVRYAGHIRKIAIGHENPHKEDWNGR